MRRRYGRSLIPEMCTENDRIHLAKRYLLISDAGKDKNIRDQLIAFYKDFIAIEENRVPTVQGLFELQTNANQTIQFFDKNIWKSH